MRVYWQVCKIAKPGLLRGLLLTLCLSGLVACTQPAGPRTTTVAAALECSPEWLAALGFAPDSQVSLQAYARRAIDSKTVIECRGGAYLPLECGNQVQLWFQRTTEDQVVAVVPYLATSSHFAAALVRTVRHDKAPALSGGLVCFLKAKPDDLRHGRFPVVFDDPAFEADLPTTLPTYRNIHLLALALRVTAYPTLEAFKHQRAVRWGPEQIQAHGVWSKRNVLAPQPSVRATMSARVLDFARRRNPLTGGTYVWARVRTRGHEMDLVAAPSTVLGQFRRGGVVVAVCDLAGRVMTW